MDAQRTWVAVTAGLVALAIPASATGATPIGTTFPGADLSCGSDATVLQSTSPSGGSYAVPFAGVITSWSFQPGNLPTSIRFKVGRSAGGNSFTIVGESPLRVPASGANTYTDVRISVQPGDVIGFYAGPGVAGQCGKTGGSSFEAHALQPGDHAPGSPPAAYSSVAGFQLSISAVLEPDADNDGFGDETQDACPGTAGPDGGCPIPDTAPPDTQITKGPKDKTKKKRATFEFSGTDARAIAGFECSLDGGAFAACASPHTVKVKKGKHTFSVRAIDGGGNADGSPVNFDWKVKKKKKR